MAEDFVIEMLHITKEFPGIKANDDITLQLRKGEVHALLGENGAGKSTLMSVLFGLYQPEAGEIKKNGKVVKINNPNVAQDPEVKFILDMDLSMGGNTPCGLAAAALETLHGHSSRVFEGAITDRLRDAMGR